MKLTILQENLLNALNITGRVTTNKGQLAVLANILIKTEAGRVKFSATNLETGINFWTGAKVDQEGQITVPAKTMIELVSLLPKEKVVLETEGEKLKLSCQGRKNKLLGIDAAEFPEVPSLKHLKVFSFKTSFESQVLKQIIEHLTFAAAMDESRPILTGVLLEKASTGWRWVATDGYRLSLIKQATEAKIKTGRWIIPARALVELGRLLNDETEKVEMAIAKTGNQVIWGDGDLEVVSKLIEGKFPDFEKVIPEAKGVKIELDREALVNAVKTASIFARDTANIIKFKLGDNQVEIKANAPELGESSNVLETKISGETGEVAFNSRYLLDLLGAISTETIELFFSGGLNPGLFKEKGNPNFIHVIMPVRVQE